MPTQTADTDRPNSQRRSATFRHLVDCPGGGAKPMGFAPSLATRRACPWARLIRVGPGKSQTYCQRSHRRCHRCREAGERGDGYPRTRGVGYRIWIGQKDHGDDGGNRERTAEGNRTRGRARRLSRARMKAAPPCAATPVAKAKASRERMVAVQPSARRDGLSGSQPATSGAAAQCTDEHPSSKAAQPRPEPCEDRAAVDTSRSDVRTPPRSAVIHIARRREDRLINGRS